MNEALKKSKPVSTLNDFITKGFNWIAEEKVIPVVDGGLKRLAPYFAFVLQAAPQLKRLANVKESNNWLSRSIEWLEQAEKDAGVSARLAEGLADASATAPKEE